MKHSLNFVELHNPLFMQGVNLGTKINATQRQAHLFFDTELGVVWIAFKNKVSFIPLANVASADLADPSVADLPLDEEQHAPPAIARARREQEIDPARYEMPDINDPEAMARHREAVRAASANANRPPAQMFDPLAQQAREQAMAVKLHNAPVSTPMQTKNLSSVTGKHKAISHAELAAQKAAENSE
jgi:hypothetical protein